MCLYKPSEQNYGAWTVVQATKARRTSKHIYGMNINSRDSYSKALNSIRKALFNR